MGGGVSVTAQTRLRKAVVIKAYNTRQAGDDTFQEQFQKYAYRKVDI